MFRLTFTLVLVATAMSNPALAGFIEDWSLTTSINPGNADIESARFREPVNPFFDSHTVSVLGSTSTTTYDFVWGPAGGMFNITASNQLAAVHGVDRRAMTAGFIYINSPLPLLISGTSEFEYNLTRDPMRAYLGLGISRLDPPQDIAGHLVSYSTAINGPQAGVLAVDFEDVLLPPNETYTMLYSFIIDADSGVSGSALATGMGTAHFEVTAIPEPGPLAFICAAGCLALVRRKRRHAL